MNKQSSTEYLFKPSSNSETHTCVQAESSTCVIAHTFTGYSQSLCVLWYISRHILEGKSMAVHSGPRTGAVRRARFRLTRENQGTQRTPNPQTSPNHHLQTRAHRRRVSINLNSPTAGQSTKRPNLHYYI